MTIVASFVYDNCATMMSDLLLAGRRVTGAIGSLPLNDDVQASVPDDTMLVPRGLCQKITLVGSNNNLAIGFAGKRDTAADVIGTLVWKNMRQPLTAIDIREYISSCNKALWKEIDLFGFLFTEDNALHSFCTPGTSHHHSNWIGNIRSIGFSAEHASGFIPDAPPKKYWTVDMDVSDMVYMIGTELAAIFLDLEIRSNETYCNFYGGGYDLAAFSMEHRAFRRLSNVAYVFWHVEETGGTDFTVAKWPFRACAYGHRNDLLIIRSGKVDDDGRIGMDELFPILPVWRGFHPFELQHVSPPRFDADAIIVHAMIRSGDGVYLGRCQIVYVADKEPSESDDEISYMKDCFTGMREQITAVLSSDQEPCVLDPLKQLKDEHGVPFSARRRTLRPVKYSCTRP